MGFLDIHSDSTELMVTLVLMVSTLKGKTYRLKRAHPEGTRESQEVDQPPLTLALAILSFCQTFEFAENRQALAHTTCCKVLTRCFFSRAQKLPHTIGLANILKQDQPLPGSPGCSFHCPSAGHRVFLCSCFQSLCCYPSP